MKSELPEAVKILQQELKNDPELYYAYQANIAMAFKDTVHRFKKKHGKVYFSNDDMHQIANDAAKEFLDLFIK